MLSQFATESLLREFPVWLSHRDLAFAFARQTKQTLTLVLSGVNLDPALFKQQPQGASQSGAVHGEASTQPFLSSFTRRGQCCEKTELCDLQTRLSEFTVVDSGDHPREAAEVLAGAREVEEFAYMPFAGSSCFHIYMYIQAEAGS